MENKYRDPESRNKTKQLKADAQKQIERNKIILKDIINTYPTKQLETIYVDLKALWAQKERKTRTSIWSGAP